MDKNGCSLEDACKRAAKSGATLRDVDTSDLKPILPLKEVRKLCLTTFQPQCLGIAWHPDSRHLASIDQGGTAVLWDTVTSSVVQYTKRPHATSVAVAPAPLDVEEKVVIAVGGIDNAITLIDMTTTRDGGESIMRLPTMGETHDGLVASLAFLDEQRIASAGGDGDVRLWDIEKGETSDVLSGHTRDCSKVAVHRPSAGYGGAPRLASSSLDGTVRLWDARAATASHVFKCGGEAEVGALCFFPTGDMIGAGCADGSVRVFDLRSYNQLVSLAPPQQASACNGIDFAKCGRALYTSHEDGSVGVWDPLGKGAGRKHRHVVPSRACIESEPGRAPVASLCMPDDKGACAVAAYDGTVRVFTTKYGGKK